MIQELCTLIADARRELRTHAEALAARLAPLKGEIKAAQADHEATTGAAALLATERELTERWREAFAEYEQVRAEALLAGLEAPELELGPGFSVRRGKAVRVTNPALVPKDLTVPNEALILEALEAGRPVPGAELVPTYTLVTR